MPVYIKYDNFNYKLFSKMREFIKIINYVAFIILTYKSLLKEIALNNLNNNSIKHDSRYR